MNNLLQIYPTPKFKKTIKKLHPHQKKELDKAIHALTSDPFLGDSKKGDLAGIRVYKFKINQQPTLLAYVYDDTSLTLTLLALGSHENFYKDLKMN